MHPGQTSADPPPNRSNRMLYAVFGLLIAAVLAGAGFWWFSDADSSGSRAVSGENRTAGPRRLTGEVSPEQEAQIKKEVSAFLENRRRTNEEKDPDAHLAHYANTLEIYYVDSGKDKNHVLADRLRAYQRYDSITMQIDNLKVTPESPDSATAVSDKSWTMKNARKTSTGSVLQEMHLTRAGGKWLIDGERDVKVYILNNRETQPSENMNQAVDNANQTTNGAR